MAQAPVQDDITLTALTRAPYPIYHRLRHEAPIADVPAARRILLTKARHTRMVKDDPVLYSSDDPRTPMARAFRAHTLMRKDGAAHRRERMAMQKAYTPGVIAAHWAPLYRQIASDYLDRLPRGAVVDLFAELCEPVAARILAHILGLDEASDAEMSRWSQTLIDGAGNFGFAEALFAASDKVNDEMDAYFDSILARHRAEPNPSALCTMLTADDPIPLSQIYANLKIAIGGGINEPRDALATILFGLLTNPEQLEEVRRQDAWMAAFEEGVRWVAPIQASSRRVTQAHQIDGIDIPEGVTLMTVQASANHDEDLFEDGHLYDVFRRKAPHQAFGNGPHHCSGAAVARKTVGEIMLPLLFERFPDMVLERPEDVVWHGFGFRGPLSLPVRLG